MPKTAATRTRTGRSPARQQPARAPRPRRKRRNEDLPRDLVAVALMALGALGLASLALPQYMGVVGHAVAGALQVFAGKGAWFVPIAILVIGVLFVWDPEKVAVDEAALGLGLLFVAFVALVQVYGVAPGQDAKPALQAQNGGWVGALVGGTLRGWVGSAGAYILLTAAAVAGLLLVLDIPLPDLLRHAGRGAAKGAETLRAAGGLRVARRNGEKPASKERKSPFAELAPEKAETKKRGKEQEPGKPPVEPAAEAAAEPEEPLALPPTVRWNRRTPKTAPPAPAPEATPEAEPRAAEASGNGAKPAPEDPKPDEEPEAPAEPPPPPMPPREYVAPPTTLLEYAQVLPEGPGTVTDTARNIKVLEETLAQFKIDAKVVEIAQGPTFTRYEIRLAPGIRVNRIQSLGDNIAMNLAALDVRIQAPIPGKAAIGIEVPNKAMASVPLREVVESPEFEEATSKLAFALGQDVTGKAWCADLARMPHLLIGGATNTGKSVCLNCLIASILFRARPDEVKFMLVDPKRVELSLFDGIPHLIYPVITDIRKAAGMLNWAIREMERRYELFVKALTRDVNSYNARAAEEGLEHLPFIIIVVDELADLMMQVAAEVEHAICRLAQLARATGIHLVIATQRPSVDVITGLIKANISSRIAFAVSSQIDSRTILDKRGAEHLLGRGDMLFDPIGASKPVRIQGAYISEKEVETLVEYLRRQASPVYTAAPVDSADGGGAAGAEMDETEDEVFEDAVRLVVTTRRASTSMLQRKFSIGYTRAARLIDMMEERGIVSALDGAKPREVLASREQIEQFFRSPLNAPGEDEEGASG